MKNESNEENIKFKKLSKAISIISKILKVFAIIGAITMLIVAIIVPYLLKRANIDENSISYNGTKIVEYQYSLPSTRHIQYVLESLQEQHSWHYP